jgi:hypothetical protein
MHDAPDGKRVNGKTPPEDSPRKNVHFRFWRLTGACGEHFHVLRGVSLKYYPIREGLRLSNCATRKSCRTCKSLDGKKSRLVP